ncbi:hypothetical protein DNTS_026679 [Danionella cerebrum]|uniref:Uncharacterized protein n=1 Tax=Danionella cerebrum TaxID=2873325 RepID=A0A553P8X4_9TELE|nr:hypothetical protein DNTS_026679 [Danionella translucida]
MGAQKDMTLNYSCRNALSKHKEEQQHVKVVILKNNHMSVNQQINFVLFVLALVSCLLFNEDHTLSGLFQDNSPGHSNL